MYKVVDGDDDLRTRKMFFVKPPHRISDGFASGDNRAAPLPEMPVKRNLLSYRTKHNI